MGRVWADGPNGHTPITAAQMNAIEADITAKVAPWKASTTYSAGQPVVNPSGDLVTAVAAHTSGATYTAANWVLMSGYDRAGQAAALSIVFGG